MADGLCGACCELVVGAAWHACKYGACGVPVHSHVMCEEQWMPEFGEYFCSKECLEAHNAGLQAAFDAIPPSDRPASGPLLLPVRKRPDAAVGHLGQIMRMRKNLCKLQCALRQICI